MGRRNRLEKAFLGAPESLADDVFQQLLESARYQTFRATGSTTKLTAMTVLTNVIAIALVVVSSSLLLVSSPMDSATPVARGLVVGVCLAVFGGAAYVLNTYVRAKFIKPKFDELLKSGASADQSQPSDG